MRDKFMAASGITPEQADSLGVYHVNNARAEIAPCFAAQPACVIPYYAPEAARQIAAGLDPDLMTWGAGEPFARVRYYQARGKMRYAQPPGSGVRAYLAPVIDWTAVMSDPQQTLVITEGEKKAAVLCLRGLPCIGLGGVWNWKKARTEALIDDLQAVVWNGRRVVLAFDSDARYKPQVLLALNALQTILSADYRAEVYVADLPDGPDGEKQGLDDLLVAMGEAPLKAVIENARRVRGRDAAVRQMNARAVWIEEEGAVLKLDTLSYIQKPHFTSGSSLSTFTVREQGPKGPKEVSVAHICLTHKDWTRFDAAALMPESDEEVVVRHGKRIYNLWRGWGETEPGDVSPYLRLEERTFAELPPDLHLFGRRLLCYKFQNPGERIPLSIMTLGQQGAGKSMWGKLWVAAAGVYGKAIHSHVLLSQYNGWIENALIVQINEAVGEHMQGEASLFKTLVSDEMQQMNEKYRTPKQVRFLGTFLCNSNASSAAHFASDDRRMFIHRAAPPIKDDPLYPEVMHWLQYEGGDRKLRHWALNYNLDGWRWPHHAPQTTEKMVSIEEGATPAQIIANRMRAVRSGDSAVLWALRNAQQWALTMVGNQRYAASARLVLDSVQEIPIRDYYTADELLVLFPLVEEGKRPATAGELRGALRDFGLPLLKSEDLRGFFWEGRWQQYVVVANFDEYTNPMSQDEFERQMRQRRTLKTLAAESRSA